MAHIMRRHHVHDGPEYAEWRSLPPCSKSEAWRTAHDEYEIMHYAHKLGLIQWEKPWHRWGIVDGKRIRVPPPSETRVYHRLHLLIRGLQEIVNSHQISISAANNLSYLSREEQDIILMCLKPKKGTIALKVFHAEWLLETSRSGVFDENIVSNILSYKEKEDIALSEYAIHYLYKHLKHLHPSANTPYELLKRLGDVLEEDYHMNHPSY